MKAWCYAICLQWKLDIRSKTLLLTCYLVPLTFYLVMGGIFTMIMPNAKETLIASMHIFGISMGALIGLPPTIMEIYHSDLKKVYQANGVPLSMGIILCDLSAFLHLSILGIAIGVSAPLIFDAALPVNGVSYACAFLLFVLATIIVADVIGLLVRDPAKVSMVSILFFLPSILFSSILFPAHLLPSVLLTAGKFFPAYWGYEMMKTAVLSFEMMLPLLMIGILALCITRYLLYRIEE